MTIEEFQKTVLEINKQFMEFKAEKSKLFISNDFQCRTFLQETQANIEILHASLDNAMVLLPVEQREEISPILKKQVTVLKRELLSLCSKAYKDEFEEVVDDRKNKTKAASLNN